MRKLPGLTPYDTAFRQSTDILQSMRGMMVKKSELMPCPFCGSNPDFPEIDEAFGACYEAGCIDCGIATISIQIIDCFDNSCDRLAAHESWDRVRMRYGDDFIKVARDEAIKLWEHQQ